LEVEAILSALGFDLQNLVAGFAGGLVVAFAFDKSDPWDIIGSVVAGGLTANYVASSVPGTSQGATAFFVGVVAMPLVKGWVVAIQRKTQ
jgi:hypothetical protein